MAHYNDWETGLNACMSAPGVCCCTFLCCPIQVALNKAALDQRDCTCYDVLFCFPCQEFFNRQQVRAKYGMPQEVFADFLSIILCTCCVVCQDAREIQYRETHVASAQIMEKYAFEEQAHKAKSKS
jgi:Cys-rich protein (TIGR01571 family)